MQVTITVPDALAAEAEARGVALDRYIEEKLSGGVPAIPGPARKLNREELRASLDALARYSAEVPSLPDEAFSRESFYEDHD
jgi:hypothetical protein